MDRVTMDRVIIRRKKAPLSVKTRRRIAATNLMVFATVGVALPLHYYSATAVLPGVRPQAISRNLDTVIPLIRAKIEQPVIVRFSPGDRDRNRFRSLNSYYVGRAKAKIDWDNVDLNQNVRYMWDRKLATFDVTPATRKSVDGIVKRFAEGRHTTTTVDAFVKRADLVVNRARASLDYPALCQRFRLSSDRCVRLQYLTGRIDGPMLVAYGMTELLPSTDGKTNRETLDMMLRRAGEDYINAIPALGDPYLSMGFYQFTSFAVRHDADGRQGASVVSQFARQGIPGSVMNLHGDDQHRAAFYFATYNLALLLMSDKSGGLSSRQYDSLKRHSPIAKEDLVTFMAAAHHLPGSARRSMAAWLQEGCREPLRRYLRGDLPTYGKKSATNYSAVRDIT